jgi:serine/threonine protein kinase
MRNFIAAVRMSQHGLPVAAPLAAVYRRRGFLFCEQSIYISEYVEGPHLYEFLENLPLDSKERYQIIRRLANQMAEILAGLHERGLWHRDAKATNFVISRSSGGDYFAAITDVDGIKPYFVRRKGRQLQALWQLAASVMHLRGVYRTDYLRMFRAYCDKVGIPAEQRGPLFRELAAKAQAKYERKSQRRNKQ